MALMTRPIAQPTVVNTTHSRATAARPAAMVASWDMSQLDELDPSVAVNFDDSSSLLPEDFGHELKQQPKHQQDEYPQRQRRHNGPVHSNTTNETFDALFRLTDFTGTEVEAKPYVRGTKGFGGLLQKAVHLYEDNAKIIRGEMIPRGSNLRLAV